jgi:menaquinone-dependent protoporphyrinogen oxidase
LKSIILYATKHGTVEKAVSKLKQEMGDNVDSFSVQNGAVPSLKEYDLVIIGGSIYMGNIQKEMKNYLKENMSLLLEKRIGLFLCAAQSEKVELQKEWENAFPEKLYNHAMIKENFGYEFDFSKMSFLEKLIIKKIKGVKESQFALSNEKITHFAAELLA